uniref:RxLR effector candidate protein n=1 Tax=Peronospora matthiolae TaxID=2874970 RepID=A0AAV1VD38_9STRA
MRLPRLLFLIFCVVDGVLLRVAALDPIDDPSSNLTAPEGLSKPHLSFVDVRKLDNDGGEERCPALGNVLQKMKQMVAKSLSAVRSLYRSVYGQVKPFRLTTGRRFDVRSSHHPSEATQGHTPEQMRAMRQTEEDEITLWLHHAGLFQEKNDGKPYSVDEMQKLLQSLPPQKNEVYYANLFAEMSIIGLEDLAESVQNFRFHHLIVEYGMTPGDLERNLYPHGRLPTSLPQTDPLYGAYKAFALEFAAVHSPSTLKELEQYFLVGDRIKADKYLAMLNNRVVDNLYPYHELTDDQRKAGK